MKKSNWTMIFTIIGAVVAIGAAVFAIIHFWEDIKKILPGKKKKEDELFDDLDEFDEFEELEA